MPVCERASDANVAVSSEHAEMTKTSSPDVTPGSLPNVTDHAVPALLSEPMASATDQSLPVVLPTLKIAAQTDVPLVIASVTLPDSVPSATRVNTVARTTPVPAASEPAPPVVVLFVGASQPLGCVTV